MLLKHRPPGIESQPAKLRGGLEHLQQSSIAVLRWLQANKIDFVLVGPVAQAIRGNLSVTGPVTIVPAPYGRNFERLCQALVAEHAGLRAEGSGPTALGVKLTADKLARGKRWLLRFGTYDLDIEAAGDGAGELDRTGMRKQREGGGTPSYQELLYEAGRFDPPDGLSVEVASPEDVELYRHVRRTGAAPEFRVLRRAPAER